MDVSASLTTKLVEPDIKHHKTPLIHRDFHVNAEESRGLQEDVKRELRRSRKLLLVLDLDNTLIFAPSPTGFSRPYLVDFLEATSKNYKLVLYTQGDDMHAKLSLNRIDPSGRYFGGRFIARKRGDDPEDKRLDYLHSSPAYIVIMDDRLDVWHQHLPNLLLVPPYEGRSDDNYLKYAIAFLRNLHARFFQRLDAGENADVREIMSVDLQRNSILAGVGCVFTGLFPQEADPTKHSFWLAAELYGARCLHHLSDPGVTHLVAGAETSKVHKAASMGLKTVTFEWMLDKWRWGLVSPDEQPQEEEYAMNVKTRPAAAAPQHKSQAAPEALREQARLRSLKRAAEEAAMLQPRPKAKPKPSGANDVLTIEPSASSSVAASTPSPASAPVDSSSAQPSEVDSAPTLHPPSAPASESSSLPSAPVPPEGQPQPPQNVIAASDI